MGAGEKLLYGSAAATAVLVGSAAMGAVGHTYGEHLVDPAAQMPPARACAADVAALAGTRTEDVKTNVLPESCHTYLDPEQVFRIPTETGAYTFMLPSARSIVQGKKDWLDYNQDRRPVALAATFAGGTALLETMGLFGGAWAISGRRRHKPEPSRAVEATA